jgi:hypothetical protein
MSAVEMVGERGGELTGRCRLDGGNEEGGAPVRFGSVRLLTRGGERLTAAHDTAALTGAAVARARPRKKKARVRRFGPNRPSGAGRLRDFQRK